MRLSPIAALVATVAFTAACNKPAPTAPNYGDAINTYYQAHPVCLWADEKKFPIQAAPDDAKTEGLDALVDQGLLTRTVTEKKIVIVSRRENNYDISQQGRAAWTADPNQPGYGNFCYGHRKVAKIDSSYSLTSNQSGTTATVDYHYTLTGLPSWASAAETQTAFPQLQVVNTPQAATVTLTNTPQGWQVTGAPGPHAFTPAKPADDKIVQ